jgi:hypothetical protein
MQEEWRWTKWLPEIVLLVATSGAAFCAGGRWVDPVGDPGTWWSTVYRLSGGERLYRDVYLQFGPLSPYLLSLGARLATPDATYMLLVTWVAAIFAALLLVRIARPFLSAVERIALVGLLLGVALFAPGPARLVFPYAPGAVHALALSFGALLLLMVERSGADRRAWLAGCLAGAAFCAKQEIGIACFVALAAAAFTLETGIGRRLGRLLLGFSGAAALGTVALLGVPWESLRRQSQIWPLSPAPPRSWGVLYARVAGVAAPDWKLTVRASSWLLLSCLAVIAILALVFSRERKPSRWLPTALLLVVLAAWEAVEAFAFRNARLITLSMLVGFIVAFFGLTQRPVADRSAVVAVGLFAGLTGARAAFSADLGGPYAGVAHLPSALTWVLFVCIFVPQILLGDGKARLYARHITAVLCLVIGWWSAALGFSSLRSPGKQEVATRAGRVFLPKELASFFGEIARGVRPGERIWVLPEINGLDALLHASAASPYPSHLPGWLDERDERRLLSRLEGNPPDAVVIFDRPTFEYGVRPFGVGYDRLLSRWIGERYEEVRRTPSGRFLRPRQAFRRPAGRLAGFGADSRRSDSPR